MLESPYSIAVLVAAMVIVAIWVWSRRRAQNDLGDFERRLAELQRPGGLSASSGATGTQGAAAVPGVATSDGIQPPRPRNREAIEDPVFGRLSYFDNEEGGEWEREGVPEIGLSTGAWLTVLAGPEGPTESQRACYQAFAADYAGILARAEALARQIFDGRGQRNEPIESGNFYVYRVKPGQDRAVGGVVFSPVGNQIDYVSIVSDDHWKTLREEEGEP